MKYPLSFPGLIYAINSLITATKIPVALISILIAGLTLSGLASISSAQEGEQHLNHVGYPAVYPPPDQPPDESPFILPFQAPPGPSTWFLGQGYGNTTGSFILREQFYMAGQGLHFG